MIRGQLMKKLFTDKTSHIGAIVNWYVVSLPMYSELYFLKEIKQKIKFLGIPFHVTTSLQNFQVPVEMAQLLQHLLDSPVTEMVDMDMFRYNFRENFAVSYAKFINKIDALDTDIDQKNNMVLNAIKGKNAIVSLLSDFTKDEENLCGFALDQEYRPMFKVIKGNSVSLYVAKPIFDRISMFKIDFVPLKRGNATTDIQHFYFTRELASKFLGVDDKYKPKQEMESDEND